MIDSYIDSDCQVSYGESFCGGKIRLYIGLTARLTAKFCNFKTSAVC
jgi:hypothetical protein